MERDDEPRAVTPPDDLVSAIAKRRFTVVPGTAKLHHQKEGARSVGRGKKRGNADAKRIEKVLAMLQIKK